MNSRTPGKPASPFALTPSARPPPPSGVRVPVRAPAAESSAVLPLSPKLSEVDVEESESDIAYAPTLMHMEAPLRREEVISEVRVPRRLEPTVRRRSVEKKSNKPIIIGAIAVGAVVVIGAIAFAVHAFGKKSEGPPARVAQFVEEPPPAAAPAPPPASVTAPPPPVSFDRDAAGAAMEAARSSLTDCKLPKTKAVRVKMTFTSSGSASSAVVLPPVTPKQAACVSRHLESVRVPAFDGLPASYIHTFAAK